MKILCPKCQKEIASTAVNVEKDTAYCENCHELFTLSDLLDNTDELQEDSHLLSQPPPSGLTVIKNANETFVVARPSRWFLLFLIPFTCVWSGGSMAGIYGSQIMKGEFDMTLSLFGIPFLLGTIFLLFLIISSLFSKIVMKLDHNGVTLNRFCFRLPAQSDEYDGARDYSHEPSSSQPRRGWFAPKCFAWKDLKTIVLETTGRRRNFTPISPFDNDSTLIIPYFPEKRRNFMLACLRDAARRQGVHPTTIRNNW